MNNDSKEEMIKTVVSGFMDTLRSIKAGTKDPKMAAYRALTPVSQNIIDEWLQETTTKRSKDKE